MNGISILAIDPGFVESAFVVYDGERPIFHGKWKNQAVMEELRRGTSLAATVCAIELVGHYGSGMAVGAEVFGTCIWTGIFAQAWYERNGGNDALLFLRKTVAAHVCGMATAKDANVRQALIDRFGGDSVAIGKKAKPGPLYGVSKDVWAALALAITAHEAPEDAARFF